MTKGKVNWNRFKSPVLWAGLIALIVEEGMEFLGINMPGATEAIVEWLTSALIAFGILNNPTNPKGF